MNEKKNKSIALIVAGLVLVVVLAAVFAGVYSKFGPNAAKNDKNVTTEAVNSETESSTEAADSEEVSSTEAADSEEVSSTEATDNEEQKTITIEVIDNEEQSTVYEVNTDAEYLRQAMEESEMEFSGTESSYGMMVETVNGVTADYNTDGAYWAFYVDGEYCMYGIDSQPVEDGQSYQIVYTTGM